MNRVPSRFFLVAAVLAGVSAVPSMPVLAAPLAPASYAMPNGDGQAHGGTYNYWDAAYVPASANNTIDGASLSGGLGKLTDGVVSTQRWDTVSNSAGTGEYVGWLWGHTPNPVINFHFAGNVIIDSISIQLDNSGHGGVYAPSAILINGVNQSFVPPVLGTVGSVIFSGLNLSGNTHSVQFLQASQAWTFVSEISFDGRAEAPEPISLALLGMGLTGIACARWRRR